MMGVCRDGEGNGDARSVARRAVDRDRAAERLDSILQPDKPCALAQCGASDAVVQNTEEREV
jgi:hypothetical protein